MGTDRATEVSNTLDLADRRRPGRNEDANPALIALLRGTGGAGFLSPEEDEDTSQLSAARGLMLAVLLAGIFWALVMASVIFMLI